MLQAHFYKHTLNFSFDAGTSRGVLRKKDSYYIKLWHSDEPEIFGLGEAGPLAGLSPDYGEAAESQLRSITEAINRGEAYTCDPGAFPSVYFALEMALLDLENKGVRQIFANSFFRDGRPVPINGLIWMGEKAFMKQQIIEKINTGFTTIKLKIGAIDFQEELALLRFIRTEFARENLVLRVDANGAFGPLEVREKLHRLAELELHSIEQPLAAGQIEELAALCAETPVPIALDEELILNYDRKKELLSAIKPQFIILKPSLMGGISGSREWISEAEKLGAGWWITSALESNIGLNAICQFTAGFENPLPQGLGTGQLYTNNFSSPLCVTAGEIRYAKEYAWDLSFFN